MIGMGVPDTDDLASFRARGAICFQEVARIELETVVSALAIHVPGTGSSRHGDGVVLQAADENAARLLRIPGAHPGDQLGADGVGEVEDQLSCERNRGPGSSQKAPRTDAARR